MLKKKGRVLVASHRGTSGGNIIQNTSLAYENALQHGADIIEMDLIMSKDGDFFAFHNGQEKLIIGTNQDIREMSTEEIENLRYYNQIGELTNQKVERAENILQKFKSRCLFNIDRSWFYWKETIEFLNKQNMQDQIILKSYPEIELFEELEKYGPDIMYMPILHDEKSWEIVKKYKINAVAAELVFENLDDNIVSKEFIDSLHEEEILVWGNSITLDDTTILSAGLDDNNAIANGYDENWGKLVDMGFDIIQTDWPAILSKYLLNFDKKGE